MTIADLLAVTLAEVNAGETKQQLCTNSRWWRLRRIAAAFEPPAMPVSDGSAKSNNGGQNEAQAYHLSRHIISTGVSSQQAYRLNSTGNDRVPIEWLLVIRDIDAEELIKKSRQQDDCRRTAFKRTGTWNKPLQITDSVALKKKEIDHSMREAEPMSTKRRKAQSPLVWSRCLENEM